MTALQGVHSRCRVEAGRPAGGREGQVSYSLFHMFWLNPSSLATSFRSFPFDKHIGQALCWKNVETCLWYNQVRDRVSDSATTKKWVGRASKYAIDLYHQLDAVCAGTDVYLSVNIAYFIYYLLLKQILIIYFSWN